MDWEVGNYGFGAAAGHPFLKAIIDDCVRAQQYPEWADPMLKSIPRMFRSEEFVLATTGPRLVFPDTGRVSGYQRTGESVIPEDVCDRNSWHRSGAYGVHLKIGAWRRRERLVRRVLHRDWEAWIRKLLLKESLKRGGKRAAEFKASS